MIFQLIGLLLFNQHCRSEQSELHYLKNVSAVSLAKYFTFPGRHQLGGFDSNLGRHIAYPETPDDLLSVATDDLDLGATALSVVQQDRGMTGRLGQGRMGVYQDPKVRMNGDWQDDTASQRSDHSQRSIGERHREALAEMFERKIERLKQDDFSRRNGRYGDSSYDTDLSFEHQGERQGRRPRVGFTVPPRSHSVERLPNTSSHIQRSRSIESLASNDMARSPLYDSTGSSRGLYEERPGYQRQAQYERHSTDSGYSNGSWRSQYIKTEPLMLSKRIEDNLYKGQITRSHGSLVNEYQEATRSPKSSERSYEKHTDTKPPSGRFSGVGPKSYAQNGLKETMDEKNVSQALSRTAPAGILSKRIPAEGSSNTDLRHHSSPNKEVSPV